MAKCHSLGRREYITSVLAMFWVQYYQNNHYTFFFTLFIFILDLTWDNEPRIPFDLKVDGRMISSAEFVRIRAVQKQRLSPSKWMLRLIPMYYTHGSLTWPLFLLFLFLYFHHVEFMECRSNLAKRIPSLAKNLKEINKIPL